MDARGPWPTQKDWTVLLVDPQDHSRNFLRLYLEGEGYRVVEARTGQDALKLARLKSPDAVITETVLPGGMKGTDLLVAMRGVPALKALPVLMVAQKEDPRERQYAEMLGAEAWWARPLEPGEVLKRLQGLLTPETGPEEVLRFWFGPEGPEGPVPEDVRQRWWSGDPRFDEQIRTRFGHDLEQAGRGDLDGWASTARGRLALVIMLDQFTRNAFRLTPRAFAWDPKAQALTDEGLRLGHDRELPPLGRVFLYMPLEHAEDLASQERCVAAFERLHEEAPEDLKEACALYLDFARRHRDVIQRFGRFPHRNRVLGRPTTPEEAEFLKTPGSSF